MRYLLAIVLPPVAVASVTLNPLTILLNIVLTILVWIPGVIHALLIVNKFYADQRNDKLIKAMKEAKPK